MALPHSFQLCVLLSVLLWQSVFGDVYMHNPRGSNNKLSEQNNNANNQNRLFDSQNNAAGGYQIGDACQPACQNSNTDTNYDETKEGAMKGAMTYYQGSELYIEWTSQHSCGFDQPDVNCQMIFQYMCEKDNPTIRDGTKRANQNGNTAGGSQEPPTAGEAADPTFGQHEPYQFYIDCKKRERNKGLYTADQQVTDQQGATATRQNANGNNNQGNRNGLECPEERDFYPYWHPSPWHDIAVLTDETTRCAYYQAESQNVKGRNYCSDGKFNNEKTCTTGGGEWKFQDPHKESPPECAALPGSRDNHLGNGRAGHPSYYLWRIPKDASGTCVLRMRYNISSSDFGQASQANTYNPGRQVGDPFFIDSSMNDGNPGNRRRTPFDGNTLLGGDPVADWLGAGVPLELEVNTNQYGRTFQDRSHTFKVQPWPSEVDPFATLLNYNVRGRRGNIVQVYPSVEYDFVPMDLTFQQGHYLHFQWTGSDANNGGNAGNGRQGTDRSNLVQLSQRGETVPIRLSDQSLFYNAKNPLGVDKGKGEAFVKKLAYLDQSNCDAGNNNDNDLVNCHLLNGASAYFNGGLWKMTELGEFTVASTRNNDFTNRVHKSTLKIITRDLYWWEILLIVLGSLVFVVLASYLTVAVWAACNPTSKMFSKKYRPRIIRWCLSHDRFARLEKTRRDWKEEQRKEWAAIVTANGGFMSVKSPPESQPASAELAKPEQAELAKPPEPEAKPNCCKRCLRFFDLGESNRTVFLVLLFFNIIIYIIGFLMNMGGGFRGNWAFPFAKGGGYALDFDLAILLLPTLKSLQTALRGKGGRAREWVPLDDPIDFHMSVAGMVALNSLIHIISHCVHIAAINNATVIYKDPLSHLGLSAQDVLSGTQWYWILTGRAYCTGILISLLMTCLFSTAQKRVRRGSCFLARRLGGFNLFQKGHKCWPVIYLLLFIHGSERFWVFMFFPVICLFFDRMVLWGSRRYPGVLITATLKPGDVISLVFERPDKFAYQAGQYVMIQWKNEWHPFTLTSCPEEGVLSVHIRASKEMDWTSALRRTLITELPAAVRNEDIGAAKEPKPGTVIEFERLFLSDKTTICKVKDATGAGGGKELSSLVYGSPALRAGSTSKSRSPTKDLGETSDLLGEGKEGKGLSKRGSTDTLASNGIVLGQDLPGAIKLQLQGPFGAPAQRVWEFDTIMLVGAGIGVTPFAAIMRSVQLRVQQRQLLQGAVGSSVKSKTLTNASQEKNMTMQILKDALPVPSKIYFYWLVRSQRELDWFLELLTEAVKGPAKDKIQINIFTTGEIELSQVKSIDGWRQFFGRPAWPRIFTEVKKAHKGDDIGVFLCGSPAIGAQLTKQSRLATDPEEMPERTRFQFFKENF